MKKINNEKNITSVKTISFFTSLSRILGYLRNFALANKFGTGIIADSFFVAFRIPNTLRKLLGEGTLSAAFIPIFSDLLINKDEKEAIKFANKVFSCLGIVLIFFTAISYVFAPWIIKIMAPGFASSADKFEITVTLLRYLFPYIIFMSFTAVAMGILNSYKHFTVSALSPILFNISFICSIIFLSPFFKNQITTIIIGVLVGGLLQLVLHIIALKKFNYIFSFDPDFKHPLIVKVAKLVFPAVFSLAITEINMIINNIIASYEEIAGKGAISALFYANFLVQLPIAIFASSIATAFFPDMAIFASQKKITELKDSFIYALKVSFFIIIPASIGLIFLANPIIKLLYEHGEFTNFSTQQTAKALIAYSAGLFAFAGIKITVPVFHSLQDTKTPMKIGVATVLLNIVLSLILSRFFGHVGLALATSISASLNFILLFFYLEKKIGTLDKKNIIKSFIMIGLISILMGITAKISFLFLNNLLSQIFAVGISIFIGILLYFGISYLIKREELFWLLKLKE